MSVHHRQQLFISLVALLTGLGGGLISQHHAEGWALMVTGALLAVLALMPLRRYLRRSRPVSFSAQRAEDHG